MEAFPNSLDPRDRLSRSPFDRQTTILSFPFLDLVPFSRTERFVDDGITERDSVRTLCFPGYRASYPLLTRRFASISIGTKSTPPYFNRGVSIIANPVRDISMRQI